MLHDIRAKCSVAPAGILINPAGVQSQVSGINLQPTVRCCPT